MFKNDQQLKEQQATLILLRHEKEDKDKQIKLFQAEIQSLQSKEKGVSDENNTTLAKLQILEKEHLEMTHRLKELQHSEEQLQQTDMELKHLTSQLQKEQMEKTNALEETKVLKQLNSDLEIDFKACHERESDLLAFTEQLTNKNVQLLSEFTSMETKIHQLKCEQEMLKRKATEYETKVDLLAKQLVNDRCKFSTENSDLTKKFEAKSKLCEALSQEVSDQQGENCIIKRKYELSLKEVNKELQQCRKKIDQYETISHSSNSSTSSLNAIDQQNSTMSTSYQDGDQVKVIQPELSLDKKALVEHIVKLQRVSARKSEKIDFLEEHVNTLVAELQRKTHLLQGYIIREQTGTLTSNKMDKNKANIAKLNGIMASVYGSRVADNSLTLELSLDINRKLQAVLEDALLKNITLKENIDTLGAEIDRLNQLLQPSYSNAVHT